MYQCQEEVEDNLYEQRIVIKQNNQITERVSSELIDLLYNAAKEDGALTNDSGFQGCIKATAAYEDAVQYLNTKYGPNLIVECDTSYIRFGDPEVFSVLMDNNIGDGVGITKEVANNTDIGSLFANNTTIESFNELKYFKVPTWRNPVDLRGCSNLTCIDLGSPTEQSNGTSNWFPYQVKLAGNSSILKFHGPESETGYIITATDNENLNNVVGITTMELHAGSVAANGIKNIPNLSKIIWKCPNGADFGANVFWGCPITEVVIDNIDDWWTYSFADIDSGPFQAGNAKLMCNGSEITQVTVPQSVSAIKRGAFRGLKRLTSCLFHNDIAYIGYYAFHNCTNLVIPNLSLPNLVTLEREAFRGVQITIISDLGQITTIPNNCFYGCNQLTTVSSLGQATSIGDSAFENCTSLTTINFPSTITSVGNNALKNTAWIDSQPDGAIIIGSCLYTYKGSAVGIYAIPSNITSVNSSCFYGQSSLTGITSWPSSQNTIPNACFQNSGLTSFDLTGIVTIEANAFRNSKLTSIVIPNSVTTLGGDCFSQCSDLTSVTIGTGVTALGRNIFSWCTSLETLVIPSNVKSLERDTLSYCTSLQWVQLESTTVVSLNNSSCFNNTNNCEIRVPANLVNDYKAASQWSNLESRIVAIQT